MRKIAVAGIGTEVGKTIVSAILAKALNADYWKPIQCGSQRDKKTVEELLDCKKTTHPEALFLKTPCSPHKAAKIEGLHINERRIDPPVTSRPLIIEGCGGIFVPLNQNALMIDLMQSWDCEWVIVSRHYLGSINHTLLTLESMKKRGLDIRGLIFNGNRCVETETAILKFGKIPCIARLKQETQWNSYRIRTYAKQWMSQPRFRNAMLRSSGILSHR